MPSKPSGVVNACNGDVSTSLTTSVVSRDLGFHFSKSVHTFPSAQTHWFLRESNGLYFSMYPTAWLGPFSSSLWWRSPPDISSVTLDHDVWCKLPSHGEAGSLFS